MIPNKKAKKSIRPRASTGNTHYGMRFENDKLFSSCKDADFISKAT